MVLHQAVLSETPIGHVRHASIERMKLILGILCAMVKIGFDPEKRGIIWILFVATARARESGRRFSR